MGNSLNVAIAYNHILLRTGLASLIKELGFEVIFQCNTGHDLVDQVQAQLPDVIIVVNDLPYADNTAPIIWITDHYPTVRVLALGMTDNETSIIRLLKNGANGYILKESRPEQLRAALDSMITRGYHFSDNILSRSIQTLHKFKRKDWWENNPAISDMEKEFLKMTGTDLTYKEIADLMHVSHRTIDSYRNNLFQKLKVKSRVGLVLYAIREGILVLQ